MYLVRSGESFVFYTSNSLKNLKKTIAKIEICVFHLKNVSAVNPKRCIARRSLLFL